MKMDLKNKKKLQIMIFVLIGVITLGVGYAAISAINLVISGNATGSPSQSSFSVVFKSASVTTGTGTASINNQDATIAYFDVSGLSKTGDTAVATYTIKNESNGVGASISLNVTNSNTEYFQVTEAVQDTELQSNEETTATITVEVIKTPVEESVTTSVVGTLTATPMENANATGSASASVTPLPPLTYKYSISENRRGQALVGEQPSFEAAKTAAGHPAVTAHIITDGIIERTYVAFEMNETVYYLQGVVSGRIEANIDVLKEAYGSGWASYCSGDSYNFNCDGGGFYIQLNDSGGVDVYADTFSWYCSVYGNGRSKCGIY